jgi:aspartyl protease family protein
MFRLLVFATMMMVGAVAAVRFVDRAARPPTASAMPVQPAPVQQPANSRTMEIRAGEGGHFGVEARVDGRRLQFLVDTGASQVVLRASDAAKLAVHPNPRDYSIKISTANGEGRAALVQLRMVEVGNIIVRDLPALIVADEALSTNLLGMSFLSRVRWSHERGKLVLEQ